MHGNDDPVKTIFRTTHKMSIFGMFSSKDQTSSTQEHIPFEEIVDDMVLLKDGSVSMVLEVSAVNFQLLSEKEQESKIKAFGDLLNSLTFPLQIVVHTEKKDVRKYLSWLESKLKKAENPALRGQIALYIEYISKLVKKFNVLQKTFYVVIPYISPIIKRDSFRDKFKEAMGKKVNPLVDIAQIIARAKVKLGPRRDHVQKQLARMGVSSHQLTTPELIGLLHRIYNPTEYIPLTIKREIETERGV